MKPSTSFIVSVARGAVISGILICILPAIAGPDAIWLSMPFTELIAAVYAAVMMVKYTHQLPAGEAGVKYAAVPCKANRPNQRECRSQ